jgi:hypothetical protein
MKGLATALLLTAAAISSSAHAQPCGPSPVPMRMDKKFSAAVDTLVRESSGKDVDLNVVELGEIGYSGSDAKLFDQKMTRDEAMSYVVDQIRDRQSAIVTGCGYYSCQIARGENAVVTSTALAVLGEVCSLGLGSSPGSASADFVFVPRFLSVALDGGKGTRIPVELRNLTDHLLELADPTVTGPVSVHRGFWGSLGEMLGRKVRVGPRQSKKFLIDVHTPAGIDPQEAGVSIALLSNAAVTAQAKLLIANESADLAAPPIIGCGTINPRMYAIARADDPNMPVQVVEFSDARPVPVGEAGSFATNGAAYPHNGDGSIVQSFSTSCSILDRTRTSLRTSIGWRNHTVARAGKCCGGGGQGGGGNVQPIWQTTIDLPGGKETKWTLSLSGNASLPSSDAACSIAFDGIEQDVSPRGPFEEIAIDATPGRHQIEARCSYTRDVGSFPPPWLAVRTSDDSFNLTIAAQRLQ